MSEETREAGLTLGSGCLFPSEAAEKAAKALRPAIADALRGLSRDDCIWLLDHLAEDVMRVRVMEAKPGSDVLGRLIGSGMEALPMKERGGILVEFQKAVSAWRITLQILH